MITASRSGPLECDYNLHKSNSTYFSDFDVGRLQLLVSLIGHGLNSTRNELAKEMPKEKAGFSIMLGGVACNFRREIKPFEGFEMWTRILAWDRKWLFVIGHFVRPGAVKPKRYIYQPWMKTRDGKGDSNGSAGNGMEGKAGAHPAIFASAIAKYCFKKGRLTIPVERVLQASQLLPTKPADHETPPVSETPVSEGTSLDGASGAINLIAERMTPDNAGEILAASLTPKDGEDVWGWSRVENERLRGMKIAGLYNGLDALNEEFIGEGVAVLGRY
ncbi:MAG: hypothetical protein Q9164_004035 [Protoblastenia rupestris]